MMPQIIATAATLLLFALLDAVWLSVMGPRLYRPEIGTLMADQVRWAPALIFYALYVLGIQIFAVAPALASGKWTQALALGALFGLFCYATYDLTNHATLKLWSLRVTIADIAWGTVATGLSAGVASAIALAVAPNGR